MKLFKHPLNADAAASTVKGVLQKIALALLANHAIKVLDLPKGKYGYASNYGEGQHGEIHLSKRLIDEARGGVRWRTELAVMTYIHEASHKFAHTVDHEGRGYVSSDDMAYAQPGLTSAEALTNADSYAALVMRVSSAIRQGRDLRKAAEAAAA